MVQSEPEARRTGSSSGSSLGKLAGSSERRGSGVQTSRFEDAHGVERLLRTLRERPLAAMPVPAHKKIQAHDKLRREVIGHHIVREQRAFRAFGEVTEALQHVRNAREEKDGRYRRQRRWKFFSTLGVRCRNGGQRRWKKQSFWRQEAGRTFFELEIRGYRPLQSARIFREEECQMVLGGTTNDTEYGAVVTQWRSAWGDQDFRVRDRGGKGFQRELTVHQWYAHILHLVNPPVSQDR